MAWNQISAIFYKGKWWKKIWQYVAPSEGVDTIRFWDLLDFAWLSDLQDKVWRSIWFSRRRAMDDYVSFLYSPDWSFYYIVPHQSNSSNIIDAINSKLDNPEWWTAGQVLTKTDDGAEWKDTKWLDQFTVHLECEDEAWSFSEVESTRWEVLNIIEYIKEQSKIEWFDDFYDLFSMENPPKVTLQITWFYSTVYVWTSTWTIYDESAETLTLWITISMGNNHPSNYLEFVFDSNTWELKNYRILDNLPEWWTAGQVLKKTEDWAAWWDAASWSEFVTKEEYEALTPEAWKDYYIYDQNAPAPGGDGTLLYFEVNQYWQVTEKWKEAVAKIKELSTAAEPFSVAFWQEWVSSTSAIWFMDWDDVVIIIPWVTDETWNIEVTQFKINSNTYAFSQDVIEAPSKEAFESLTSKVDQLELAKDPNVTVVGTPTILQGNISNFDTNSYLIAPFLSSFSNNPFVLHMDIATWADVTTQQNIVDSVYWLAVAIKDWKFLIALSTNGTSWNIWQFDWTNTVLANTDYHVEVEWTWSLVTLKYSTDWTNYTTDITAPLTTALSGKPLYFWWFGATSHPFKWTFNFNEWYFLSNGNKVWMWMDSVWLETRANVSLSNLDEEGEAKLTEKLPVVVEEVPAEEVAGKMYFLKDKEEVVTLKTYEELIAMNNSQAIVDELNKDWVAYYESLTSHLFKSVSVYWLVNSSNTKWFSDWSLWVSYNDENWIRSTISTWISWLWVFKPVNIK